MFSSEHIENEMISINSEPPSSGYHFDTKLQAKLSPSDQIFEKQED